MPQTLREYGSGIPNSLVNTARGGGGMKQTGDVKFPMTPVYLRILLLSTDVAVTDTYATTSLLAMKTLHDLPTAGYLGYKKTHHRIRSQFHWKGVNQDIKAFVRSCFPCQSRKPPRPRHCGHLQLSSPSRPFEAVGIDIWSTSTHHSRKPLRCCHG